MRRDTFAPTLAVCFGLVLSCAAEPSPQPQSQPQQPPNEASTATTVAEIAADPAGYEGRIVTLQGLFRGWNATGCRLPAAASQTLTRSDWLIQTGLDCLYVTGGWPAGLAPADPGNVGRGIRLEARVARREDGTVYLEYVGGEPL